MKWSLTEPDFWERGMRWEELLLKEDEGIHEEVI